MWQRVQPRLTLVRHRPCPPSSSSLLSSPRPLVWSVGGASLRCTIASAPRDTGLLPRGRHTTTRYQLHLSPCNSSSSCPTVTSKLCFRNSGRNRARNGSNDTRSSATTASNNSRGADEDSSALLRRVATYIEEDPRAADKLGKVMGQGTARRVSAALDGMEYAVREPSFKELRRVATINAVPFVGFGFMDNAIMIVAGEYVDMTVGVAMGISTMAAAALGNTISDVAGVGLGGFIESMAQRLGLPPSKLSRAQMTLRRTRIAALVGSTIGVTIGCLVGMFPLVFLPDQDVVEAVKRKEKMVGLIDAVVEEAASFLSASNATLYILDREKGTLWARRRGVPGTPNADAVQDLKIELEDQGAVSGAARTGEAVNFRSGRGGTAPSMLCMPVFGADGLVAGVVQVVGKTAAAGKAADGGFTAEDAKDLSALCSHISVALENIKRTDESNEVDLRETIALMRSYGGVEEQKPFPQHRSTSAGRVLPSLVSKAPAVTNTNTTTTTTTTTQRDAGTSTD